jgi:hypothetical protein
MSPHGVRVVLEGRMTAHTAAPDILSQVAPELDTHIEH